MSRKPPIPRCSEEERKIWGGWAHSRTLEVHLVERAKIIIGCLEKKSVNRIARERKVRPNTVIGWRRRFEKEGMAGLYDHPRSGKPPQ